MSTFWIREGDTLPVIRSTVVDAAGAPIDLTNAVSVQLVLTDWEGTPYTSYAASFATPRTSGILEYAWRAGDTDDNAGTYRGSWVIVWPGDETQTFPTDGAVDIVIASSTGVINGFTPDILLEARQRAGEVGDTTYSDARIAELLTKRTGDTAAVAYDIWSFKASDAANLVDMTESRSSRKFSDLYKQCLEMATFWGKQSDLVNGSAALPARRSTTRAIERP